MSILYGFDESLSNQAARGAAEAFPKFVLRQLHCVYVLHHHRQIDSTSSLRCLQSLQDRSLKGPVVLSGLVPTARPGAVADVLPVAGPLLAPLNLAAANNADFTRSVRHHKIDQQTKSKG